MTLYGSFEVVALAAVGGWALWHVATRVLKLGAARRIARSGASACGSGCGGCSSGSGCPTRRT
jgi:hypothetical protein